jgi:hypothetical protein
MPYHRLGRQTDQRKAIKINYFVLFDGRSLMNICNNQQKLAGVVEEGRRGDTTVGRSAWGATTLF